MTKPVIEIENIRKSFSDFKALKGISLQINQGEIMGLLGPNGAGKSTTIKILTGLLTADQGTIEILGEKIDKSLPVWIREKIAVVFEESNLYLRLTALDNLKLFAGIHNVSKNRVYELLEEYQLLDAAQKEVKNFSKGMKKRLMICRALMAEPEILILDEATGGLDPISAEIIRKKVLELKDENKTVILSTHYLEEADRLCDRIAFINNGQLIAVNTPTFFKNKLSKNYLEIKFSTREDIKKQNLVNILEKILDSNDNYNFESGILTLNLVINENIFAKAKKAAAEFDFLNLNKIEADLQEVFKNLNS